MFKSFLVAAFLSVFSLAALANPVDDTYVEIEVAYFWMVWNL